MLLQVSCGCIVGFEGHLKIRTGYLESRGYPKFVGLLVPFPQIDVEVASEPAGFSSRSVINSICGSSQVLNSSILIIHFDKKGETPPLNEPSGFYLWHS
jgi:hypothetical protein